MTTTSSARPGLATRYRPSSFAEVAGQRHVAAVLTHMLRAGTLPQQLLFSGGSGLGKTTLARICAAAILCETPLDQRPDADVCGTCDACRDILTPGRSHPDVIEFDAASHGGKDEVRDIAAKALLAPLRADYKIYIIDEAQGLTGPGGQAFLKFLEEPPPHVVIMLATTDPQKMAKPNRGRCTEFELLRPTDPELVDNLLRVAAGEGWTLEQDTAAAVVAATRPELGARGTLMTLEKLAGALASGAPLTADMVAALLGTAPAHLVTRLTDALLACDPTTAHQALSDLRNRCAEAEVRRALVEWARGAFHRAAGSGNWDTALDRLETLASTQGDPVWTDLAIARLARPAATSPASVSQDQAAVTAAPAPTPVIAPAMPDAPTPDAPAPAPAPASADGESVVNAFRAALAQRSGRLAAMARSCTLTGGPGQVTLVFPASMHAALHAPQALEHLHAAATEAGARLVLQQAA